MSIALFGAGIALCYFVWLWHFLAVICVLLLLVGIGLCKRNLSVRQYHIILVLNAIGLFPLLRGHSSVAEVALHSGFTDQNYFARMFKQQYRITPLEYCRTFR